MKKKTWCTVIHSDIVGNGAHSHAEAQHPAAPTTVLPSLHKCSLQCGSLVCGIKQGPECIDTILYVAVRGFATEVWAAAAQHHAFQYFLQLGMELAWSWG